MDNLKTDEADLFRSFWTVKLLKTKAPSIFVVSNLLNVGGSPSSHLVCDGIWIADTAHSPLKFIHSVMSLTLGSKNHNTTPTLSFPKLEKMSRLLSSALVIAACVTVVMSKCVCPFGNCDWTQSYARCVCEGNNIVSSQDFIKLSSFPFIFVQITTSQIFFSSN